MSLIKKSILVIKNYGFKVFLHKLVNWPRNRLYILKEKILDYLARKNLDSLINKLNSFNSSNPDEIFDFSWNFYGGLIRPYQIKEEFIELLRVFKDLNPKYFMEIGTARGGTLFCFCKLAKEDSTVISIDLPGGSFGGGYPEWKIPLYKAFTKKNQTIHLIRGNSHDLETLERVKQVLDGNKLDFLFIDGDHTYEGVKKDFEMYGSLVREGGIIAFHDIVIHKFSPNVRVFNFWNEIKRNFEHREIVRDYNQIDCGIGLIRV